MHMHFENQGRASLRPTRAIHAGRRPLGPPERDDPSSSAWAVFVPRKGGRGAGGVFERKARAKPRDEEGEGEEIEEKKLGDLGEKKSD